jgi:hypothetical protein
MLLLMNSFEEVGPVTEKYCNKSDPEEEYNTDTNTGKNYTATSSSKNIYKVYL